MLIVIGGGPAGFFAAIRARELAPGRRVVLLEKSRHVLRKVAISGGGRCNVTHACFEPRELVTRYPRGRRELRGPFHAFDPSATVAWFAERGVPLKTESDGRMFPQSDSSATIVDCLRQSAQQAGVEVRLGAAVTSLARDPAGYRVYLADDDPLTATAVLLASGGQTSGGTGGYELAATLGHTVAPPVPSLFTLRIADPILNGLAGVAVPEATVRVEGNGKLSETGPVLVTHWGLSGPAVLRLSAWGARHFHDCDYHCRVAVDWLPAIPADTLDARLQAASRSQGKQLIHAAGWGGLPKRLWQALATASAIPPATRWSDLTRQQRRDLRARLGNCLFTVAGQAVNKEEFVTCGGVALAEVDFKTMASRVAPGLFLAGEVLDIDGITGGFNFQSCWTTGWLAGAGLAAYEPIQLSG